jgi:hypothetical protein
LCSQGELAIVSFHYVAQDLPMTLNRNLIVCAGE